MSAVASAAVADAPLRSIRPQWREDAGIVNPPPRPTLEVPSVDDLIQHANLNGEVAFVVADGDSGLVLEERDGGVAMPPASVAKSVTALYAFDALGQDFRFETQLIATGGIRDGKIQGDLILAGAGDPTFDTDAIGDMVEKLKALGVTGITGAFRTYGGALPYVRSIDPTQPDHLGYNPAVSGLNLNFNRVHFQWTKSGSGYSVEMDARSDRYKPDVTTAKMKVVNRDLPVYTYAAGTDGIDEWTVAQGALGNGGSRWLPVRRPDLYCGDVFHVVAKYHGVTLPRPTVLETPPKGTPVVTHKSHDLSTIVRDMLLYSTNITAEAIGLAASRARGIDVQSLEESGAAMSAWMRDTFGAQNARLTDHSGLSDTGTVSSSDLVKMLVKSGPGGALHEHMKTVAVKDEEGKLTPDAPYDIRAKTGTLNFVSCLAGYVTGADGNVICFAILTGDLDRRASLTRAQRERPPGGRGWASRSRWLQQQLIARWMTVYGA